MCSSGVLVVLYLLALCYSEGINLQTFKSVIDRKDLTEINDEVCAQYDSDCDTCTLSIKHDISDDACGWVGDREWEGSRCLHGNLERPFSVDRPLIWEFMDGTFYGNKCCSGLKYCSKEEATEGGETDYCTEYEWCAWCTKGYDTLTPAETDKPGLCFSQFTNRDTMEVVRSYNCTGPVDSHNCCASRFGTCQDCYGENAKGLCTWCGDENICTESPASTCTTILVNCCESFKTCETCQGKVDDTNPHCTWCASQNVCVDFKDALGISSTEDVYYTGVYTSPTGGGTCDKVITGDSSYCSGCSLAITKEACVSSPDCVWIADPVQSSSSSNSGEPLTPFCTSGDLWGAKNTTIADRRRIRYSYSTYYWGISNMTGESLIIMIFTSAILGIIAIIVVTCSVGMHRRNRLRQLAECEDESSSSSLDGDANGDIRGARAIKFNRVEWESSD